MSTLSDKIFGTSKQSAYLGWFSTLVGGIMVGAGVIVMILTRLISEMLTANFIVEQNAGAFANVQLYGATFIFLGITLAILGLLATYHSQKKIVSQSFPPPPVSMEKKFCRFCGTENKKEAVFCEKCGKQISET